MGKGEWRRVWNGDSFGKGMNNGEFESAMRDRENIMDHEIENGERMIYSRMMRGELRIEVRIKLSIE